MVANTHSIVLKCVLVETEDVQRLRYAGPLEHDALRAALSDAFDAALTKVKYEDDEGDWCTLTSSSFEDFLVLKNGPVVKLRVWTQPLVKVDRPLPIPDGRTSCAAAACGPKPFLTALQHLSHGCEGGWTAENVCVIVLAFLPTLEQRAVRKVDKLNKNGPSLVSAARDALQVLQASFETHAVETPLQRFLGDVLSGHKHNELGAFVVALFRFLRTVPFATQKNVLLPALSALLQSRPSLFIDVFGEGVESSDPFPAVHSDSKVDVVQLASGRLEPQTAFMTISDFSQSTVVHVVSVDMRDPTKNGWANLRISADGKVGIGDCGDHATFQLFPKGVDAQGLQRIALKSCGGGGYLSYDGAGGFCGCSENPASIFSIAFVGLNGAGGTMASTFSLIPEVNARIAVGVQEGRRVCAAPMDSVDESNQIASAFFFVHSNRKSKAKDAVIKVFVGEKRNMAKISETPKCDEDATKIGVQAAKEPAKLEIKAAKEAAKLEKQATKEAKKEAAKEAAKLEKQAVKEAKQASKLEQKEREREDAAKKTGFIPVAALSEIVDGSVVLFDAGVPNGRLRMDQKGTVNMKGGHGTWTHFVVHLKTLNGSFGDCVQIALQSQPRPDQYLSFSVGKGLVQKSLAHDDKPLAEACLFDLKQVDGQNGYIFELCHGSAESTNLHPGGQFFKVYIEDADRKSQENLQASNDKMDEDWTVTCADAM